MLRNVWTGEKSYARVYPTRGKRSIIDFMFLSKGIETLQKGIQTVSFNNHRMLTAQLSLKHSARSGKGIWKLYIQLLWDVELRQEYMEMYKAWNVLNKHYKYGGEW